MVQNGSGRPNPARIIHSKPWLEPPAPGFSESWARPKPWSGRGFGPRLEAGPCTSLVEEHLMLSHAKYASAREALLSLARHLDRIGWEHKLQPLKKTHLRPIGDFGQQTQGTAILSWIWLTHGISSDDSEGL
ncbi:hypothetical protein BDR05DRAFT_142180 [Suillus weaverae]|nr:hypothetical protein BDR05DRAFT_142180 [Suillus weaverae]